MKKIIIMAATLIASALLFTSCQTSSCNCGLGQAEQPNTQVECNA